MKSTFLFCLCISLVLTGCDSHVKHETAEVSAELRELIISKLEGIALDFLKSWEPPYDPDTALALFTQKDDFH